MNHELLLYGIIILVLLLVSAFFSAAETAMTAISRARIYQLVMDGNRAAKLVTRLRREKESMIGAVLLGYNAVNIFASVLATGMAIKYFGNDHGMAITTVAMTLLVVVFAEILPKTYAIHNAERTSLALAQPLRVCVLLLRPITFSIQFFIRGLFGIFGIDITGSDSLISATDVLRGTIEMHHREGKMIKQDRDMLGSILDLHDIDIKEVMTHRKHVETLDAELPAGELVAQAVSTMHSRIPLWRGEQDNIVGVLHVKNLIRLMSEQHDHTGSTLSREAILATCTKPWFIPETTSLRDQLVAFRSQRQHFAFVVDEYGGWQGIITLEDIIEEIVGDIDDEHDEAESDIQKAGPDLYYVNGGLSLRDLNRELDWNLPDDQATTVAGLLIHAAQTIPAVGEGFDIHGFRFTVVSKSATQITRLRIEKLQGTQLPEDMEV